MTNAGRAQSDDFDLAKLVFRHAFAGVTSGYIPAASNMPVIDMTKPWYVQKMNEKMVVDGVAMLAYTTFDKNPGGASIIFNKPTCANPPRYVQYNDCGKIFTSKLTDVK